jgi:RNA-directed DNA polymerase
LAENNSLILRQQIKRLTISITTSEASESVVKPIPETIVDDEIVDLTELFTQRVKELGLKQILYTDIINPEALKQGLAKTKSGVAPGLDGIVKANFTDEKLEKLFKELNTHKYKPSKTKRVLIPKPDGGKRPLGIASQKDKVVQASILTVFEPVLEKIFLENSYGFRPKLNCHNALRTIKRKWQNVTWIINIDISKYFDTINHEILLKMIHPFCDQATKELIGKMLSVGYIDMANLANSIERASVGTPQGSLISPILANLYLHPLDVFIVEKLLPK